MTCPECGATIAEVDTYHTRPDNLATCPGPKADKPEKKPARKPKKQ